MDILRELVLVIFLGAWTVCGLLGVFALCQFAVRPRTPPPEPKCELRLEFNRAGCQKIPNSAGYYCWAEIEKKEEGK